MDVPPSLAAALSASMERGDADSWTLARNADISVLEQAVVACALGYCALAVPGSHALGSNCNAAVSRHTGPRSLAAHARAQQEEAAISPSLDELEAGASGGSSPRAPGSRSSDPHTPAVPSTPTAGPLPGSSPPPSPSVGDDAAAVPTVRSPGESEAGFHLGNPLCPSPVTPSVARLYGASAHTPSESGPATAVARSGGSGGAQRRAESAGRRGADPAPHPTSSPRRRSRRAVSRVELGAVHEDASVRRALTPGFSPDPSQGDSGFGGGADEDGLQSQHGEPHAVVAAGSPAAPAGLARAVSMPEAARSAGGADTSSLGSRQRARGLRLLGDLLAQAAMRGVSARVDKAGAVVLVRPLGRESEWPPRTRRPSGWEAVSPIAAVLDAVRLLGGMLRLHPRLTAGGRDGETGPNAASSSGSPSVGDSATAETASPPHSCAVLARARAMAQSPFGVGWECCVTAHRAMSRLAPLLADLPAALTAPLASHPVVGIFERAALSTPAHAWSASGSPEPAQGASDRSSWSRGWHSAAGDRASCTGQATIAVATTTPGRDLLPLQALAAAAGVVGGGPSSLAGSWSALRARLEALQRPSQMQVGAASSSTAADAPGSAGAAWAPVRTAEVAGPAAAHGGSATALPPSACRASRPDIDEDESRELSYLAATANADSRAAINPSRFEDDSAERAREAGMPVQQARKHRASLLARVESLSAEYVVALNSCDGAAEAAFVRALTDEASELRRRVNQLGRKWFALRLLEAWVRSGVLPQSAQHQGGDPSLAEHAGRVELLEARLIGQGGGETRGRARAATGRQQTGDRGSSSSRGPPTRGTRGAQRAAGLETPERRKGRRGVKVTSVSNATAASTAVAPAAAATQPSRRRPTRAPLQSVLAPALVAAKPLGVWGAVGPSAPQRSAELPSAVDAQGGSGSSSQWGKSGSDKPKGGLLASALPGLGSAPAKISQAQPPVPSSSAMAPHAMASALAGAGASIAEAARNPGLDPPAAGIPQAPAAPGRADSELDRVLSVLRQTFRGAEVFFALLLWLLNDAGCIACLQALCMDMAEAACDGAMDPVAEALGIEPASTQMVALRRLRAAGRVLGATVAASSWGERFSRPPAHQMAAAGLVASRCRLPLDVASFLHESQEQSRLVHASCFAHELVRVVCSCRHAAERHRRDLRRAGEAAASCLLATQVQLQAAGSQGGTAWLTPGRAIASAECFGVAALTLSPPEAALAQARLWAGGLPASLGPAAETVGPDRQLRSFGWQSLLDAEPSAAAARSGLIVRIEEVRAMGKRDARVAPMLAESASAHGPGLAASESSVRAPKRSATTLLSHWPSGSGGKRGTPGARGGGALQSPNSLAADGDWRSSPRTRELLDAALMARYPAVAALLDSLTPSVLDSALDRLAQEAVKTARAARSEPPTERALTLLASQALATSARELVAATLRPALAGVAALLLDRSASSLGVFVECAVAVGVSRVDGMIRARAVPVLRPLIAAALRKL